MLGNILLVTPSKKTCGNFSTISRIREHLEKKGWHCYLGDPSDFKTIQDYTDFLDCNSISMVIGIHAYKTGMLIKDGNRPYLMVLGGTDVNEMYKDKDKMAVMTQAIQTARGVLCFTRAMKEKLFKYWPDVRPETVHVIPQAVTVAARSPFNIRQHIKIQHPILNITDDMKIFVIVGGIRKVKNPLYLVEIFSEWQANNAQWNCLLLLIGPKIEEDYVHTFQEKIKGLKGVTYIEELTMENTHTAIRDSFALVNTSDSEGMSVTILEAMLLGTPLIVRDIPGNLAIVKDGDTGLTFGTPQEFIVKAEMLLDDEDQSFRGKLTHDALEYVAMQHSMDEEQRQYVAVVDSIVN